MKGLHEFEPILKIARYTFSDDARQKSFIAMFILCGLIVFLFRGCFQGSYVVNGRVLESTIIVRAVSQLFFQAITAGTMFLTALISMRVLRRDSDYGTQSYILSKPISRRQYIFGKVSGLWLLAIVFMFILHTILLVTASVDLKTFVAEFFTASLLCVFNLLFIVVSVLFLSLILPDVLAFICVTGIALVSFVGEWIYSFTHSQFGQAAERTDIGTGVSLWDILYYFWPKLGAAQHSASLLVGTDGFRQIGSLYPFANVILYCIVFGVLLLWRFGKKEIT
ncbi:MAG TPA: ABC transporter permease subunit [Syntrophorhabdaceae bacterium]|nr:ABC transporter permease subunit [Syntrophorhabdaceae bacterium]